ncbi:MAG: hypothetical protein WCB00_04655, partial [Candidatus Acidiferrales bacterium]
RSATHEAFVGALLAAPQVRNISNPPCLNHEGCLVNGWFVGVLLAAPHRGTLFPLCIDRTSSL